MSGVRRLSRAADDSAGDDGDTTKRRRPSYLMGLDDVDFDGMSNDLLQRPKYLHDLPVRRAQRDRTRKHAKNDARGPSDGIGTSFVYGFFSLAGRWRRPMQEARWLLLGGMGMLISLLIFSRGPHVHKVSTTKKTAEDVKASQPTPGQRSPRTPPHSKRKKRRKKNKGSKRETDSVVGSERTISWDDPLQQPLGGPLVSQSHVYQQEHSDPPRLCPENEMCILSNDNSVEILATPPMKPCHDGDRKKSAVVQPSTAVCASPITDLSSSMLLVVQTPTTTREFASHVKAVASVVSSTGLNRRESLKMANETVLRRLESEFSNASLEVAECRRIALDETRRREDRQIAERRHHEALKAIRRDPSAERTLDEARLQYRRVIFRVFPGAHFITCVGIALIARLLQLKSKLIMQLIARIWDSGTLLAAILDILPSQVCGCAADAIDDGGSGVSYSTYMLSMLPSQSLMKNSFVQSATCVGGCFLKFCVNVAALSLVHRVLGFFHCHESVHNGINLIAVLLLVLPALIDSSPGAQQSGIVLAELFCYVALSNAILVAGSFVLVRSFSRDKGIIKHKRNDSSHIHGWSKDSSDFKRIVFVYRHVAHAIYVLSTATAVFIGGIPSVW